MPFIVNPMVGGSTAPTTATLYNGSRLAITSPNFWGIVAQTSSNQGIAKDASVGKFLNATPFNTFTFSQMSDYCNMTANRQYNDAGVASTGCNYNIPAVKAWCGSRSATCTSIIVLPGENNNSREDGNIANYIVNTLHFQPTYFAIGNEPQLWKHYGKPWTSWRTSDNVAPSAIAYAFDVKAGIAAVRSVVSSAKFIGIESDCQCEKTWFAAVAKIDGGNIAAVAYHNYPSAKGQTTVTAAQFFAPLIGNTNTTSAYAQVRAALQGQCTKCSTLPIFVTEYNSGPGWAPSNLAGTWSNAVFLAASTTQALRANITSFSIFHLQSPGSSYNWCMLNGNDAMSPSGSVYQRMLAHLQTGLVYGTRIVTSVTNVWSVLTVNGRQHTLLVVNANAGKAIQLGLNSVLQVHAGTTPTVYQWSGSGSGPTVTTAALSANGYTVPSQGILLISYVG